MILMIALALLVLFSGLATFFFIVGKVLVLALLMGAITIVAVVLLLRHAFEDHNI